MRSTTLDEEQDRANFACRAAQWFAENPQGATFGDIGPGAYVALRWGMGNDCVLVLKIDENVEPVNFQQLVRQVVPKATP